MTPPVLKFLIHPLTVSCILGIILIWSYQVLLVPAYYSFIVDCHLYKTNNNIPPVAVVGTFSIQNSTPTINMYVNESNSMFKPYLRHETCHAMQYQENRSYGCDSPLSLYGNEVEAYLAQNTWYKC